MNEMKEVSEGQLPVSGYDSTKHLQLSKLPIPPSLSLPHIHIWVGFSLKPQGLWNRAKSCQASPAALTTMWPIMWEAGSPDILSLTHPLSPIINPSAPGGCCCTHAAFSEAVARIYCPSPCHLGLLLPLPALAHMVFHNGIPSLIYSTKAKATAKLSLDTATFSWPQIGPPFIWVLRPDWVARLATPSVMELVYHLAPFS